MEGKWTTGKEAEAESISPRTKGGTMWRRRRSEPALGGLVLISLLGELGTHRGVRQDATPKPSLELLSTQRLSWEEQRPRPP